MAPLHHTFGHDTGIHLHQEARRVGYSGEKASPGNAASRRAARRGDYWHNVALVGGEGNPPVVSPVEHS